MRTVGNQYSAIHAVQKTGSPPCKSCKSSADGWRWWKSLFQLNWEEEVKYESWVGVMARGICTLNFGRDLSFCWAPASRQTILAISERCKAESFRSQGWACSERHSYQFIKLRSTTYFSGCRRLHKHLSGLFVPNTQKRPEHRSRRISWWKPESANHRLVFLCTKIARCGLNPLVTHSWPSKGRLPKGKPRRITL